LGTPPEASLPAGAPRLAPLGYWHARPKWEGKYGVCGRIPRLAPLGYWHARPARGSEFPAPLQGCLVCFPTQGSASLCLRLSLRLHPGLLSFTASRFPDEPGQSASPLQAWTASRVSHIAALRRGTGGSACTYREQTMRRRGTEPITFVTSGPRAKGDRLNIWSGP
jgi:hypothetical protein